jgi:intergrase/recombinase
MLGTSLAHVVFKWEPGFEEFLRERKKHRRVASLGTLSYYRNLFKKHLEGKALSEELVDYVVNHENKWLRNVFRHYVQYLYYSRKIPPETYGWLMEVVPSRSYRLDVRPYLINLEDVAKTLKYLESNHELYYLAYRLMLEGESRLSHALLLIKSFSPGDLVEIPGVDLETDRLVCFEERGLCRYYLGVRGYVKPCEWAYFSLETLKLLEKHAGRKINRSTSVITLNYSDLRVYRGLYRKKPVGVHVGFNSYGVVFEDYRSIIIYGDNPIEIGIPSISNSIYW